MKDLKLDQKILRIVPGNLCSLMLRADSVIDVVNGELEYSIGTTKDRSIILTTLSEVKHHVFNKLNPNGLYTLMFDIDSYGMKICVHEYRYAYRRDSLRYGGSTTYKSTTADDYKINDGGQLPFLSVDDIFNAVVTKIINDELLSNIEYEVKC